MTEQLSMHKIRGLCESGDMTSLGLSFFIHKIRRLE